MSRTERLEGKIGKSRYTLELVGDEIVEAVRYFDQPKTEKPVKVSVTDALSAFRIPPNAQLIRIEPEELAPDSEIAAYWFTRNAYSEIRRPVFFYHHETMLLCVFPPPRTDETKIIIGVSTDEEVNGESDAEQS